MRKQRLEVGDYVLLPDGKRGHVVDVRYAWRYRQLIRVVARWLADDWEQTCNDVVRVLNFAILRRRELVVRDCFGACWRLPESRALERSN
jgi:hypothetical protein